MSPWNKKRVATGIQTAKPPEDWGIRTGKKPAVFEFCCSSGTGEVNEERNRDHFRPTTETSNMANFVKSIA